MSVFNVKNLVEEGDAMFKRNNLFVTSGYVMFVVMLVLCWISLAIDFGLEISSSFGLLFLASAFVTMINSSKYTELGQVFQIKKDLWIFRFIHYDENTYSNLPVEYVLIILGYFMSIVLCIGVLLFTTYNWKPFLIGVGSFHLFQFAFLFIELTIVHFKN